MTNEDILKVARDHQWLGGAEGWTFNSADALITFSRRIAAMQRDLDAGICKQQKSVKGLGFYDGTAHCAKAILEQSDD